MPLTDELTRDWVSVLTGYAPFSSLMRPYRVVYTAPLQCCREELVKVRVQGILSEQQLGSVFTGCNSNHLKTRQAVY